MYSIVVIMLLPDSLLGLSKMLTEFIIRVKPIIYVSRKNIYLLSVGGINFHLISPLTGKLITTVLESILPQYWKAYFHSTGKHISIVLEAHFHSTGKPISIVLESL